MRARLRPHLQGVGGAMGATFLRFFAVWNLYDVVAVLGVMQQRCDVSLPLCVTRTERRQAVHADRDRGLRLQLRRQRVGGVVRLQ